MAVWYIVQAPALRLRPTKDEIDTGKVALYVFGDSLFDTGMTLYHESKGIGAAKFWPYGETYFKKPAGRFCDGRIDFTRQVEYFREMVQKMKQQIGEDEANNVISKAVYLFDIIGGNDYVQLIKDNINKTISPSFKQVYTREILGNISVRLKTIYNEGARKFAFQTLGPLGCQPNVKYTLGYKGLCAKELQDMIITHNAEFFKLMKELESQLPEFKYTVYDFYSSAYLRNPSDHLWFDGGHTTEEANRQLSQEFWSGSPNLVAPYNLKAFFAMP
ncbi:hypothetical protein Cgig2_027572 [Carnegiea gigantea]|uniref:Uncharacterized protein n=1 Tax=Carnegiea gigantea TaxID=171969 RepID=A0A9Q1JVK5_9CARY|nr:hypothetical protein Cgig2_027572 [Carnegiea gigantea]